MKKVAIVGVEGSGKTVMLAGLGDLYTYPDEEGYFLAPKNFGTAAYVAEKMQRMRKGEWPFATAGDEMQGLDWTLKRRQSGRQRPEDICEVSFLDFAGEVYRAAFGIGGGDASIGLQAEAERLKAYVREADDIIVLINLRDVIANGLGDLRVQESMWITNSILEAALAKESGRPVPRAAIVLSQADSYAETINSCGGPNGVLSKFLPHVANNYGWLDIFAASAVDKTMLDDGGNVVPAPDFAAKGLVPILEWILDVGDASQPSDDGTAAEGDIVLDVRSIEVLLAQYRCDDLFYRQSPKFPAKLGNMTKVIQEKCNRQVSSDDAVAILDCTVFGSAKNGILFCRTGFYALNDWTSDENTGFVSWADFLQYGNIKGNDSDLHLCDSPNVGINVAGCDFDSSKTAAVFNALREMIRLVQ